MNRLLLLTARIFLSSVSGSPLFFVNADRILLFFFLLTGVIYEYKCSVVVAEKGRNFFYIHQVERGEKKSSFMMECYEKRRNELYYINTLREFDDYRFLRKWPPGPPLFLLLLLGAFMFSNKQDYLPPLALCCHTFWTVGKITSVAKLNLHTFPFLVFN